MKNILAALSVLAIISMPFAVSAQVDKEDAGKGFHFPEDLGKGETIILIAPFANDKVTDAVIEAFEKEYKGKFEATGANYAKVKKYQDDKYRYAVLVLEQEEPARWIGKERWPATTNYKFGLLDFKTGKSYYNDFWSGSYKKGAKYYVKHLEEWRKKNAGE